MRGDGATSANSVLGLAVYPPMAFGISIVAFTLQLVREKEVKTKHVALAQAFKGKRQNRWIIARQGLSVRSFWLGTGMVQGPN